LISISPLYFILLSIHSLLFYQKQTLEKFDRILVITEWELKYPQVTIRALFRGIFDYAPLLLDTGIPSHPKANRFKFELAIVNRRGLNGFI
jgi:hypothetical protein